jgi:alpha-L-glutamate ligase-like protein
LDGFERDLFSPLDDRSDMERTDPRRHRATTDDPAGGGDAGAGIGVGAGGPDRFRDRIPDRLLPFAPIAAIAAALSMAGLLVGATIGPESLAPARTFFQIVLAGATMAVLRNEAGLPTYGLFAPVVIAFIMLGAGPVWGLVLFVNVLAVTLATHRALGPLKLGTAPRVAVLLSVSGIATALAVAAAGAGYLPPLSGSGQVFFPTVISAWYADRAATEIEERGWAVPAKRLLGTLAAVVLSYAVIGYRPLVDWFVATPPAWGLALLAVAYLGSRSGFRLSEHARFRSHYAGRLGPLSVTLTHARWWLGRLAYRVGRLVGRDVDPPAPRTAVLGIRRRNRYIEAYNPPHLRPSADEKAAINARLNGLSIPAPRTYAVVSGADDFDAVDRVIDRRDEFVVKPSKGYGGEGIVVVSGREGDRYDTSKGPMTRRDLRAHVRRIVDGHYSGLEGDGTAIVEEKLSPAAFMRDLHGDGVADVRVIVFRGYPVMAMTRLPTEESGGAANLHLGAVGVGLSVANGTPLDAYQQSRDRYLDAHPDTGASLTEFRVPDWEGVLRTAVEAAAASGLGYTGVDVVLAEGNVPKVLEVNVRPGLGIQNTTGRGIFERLRFVEGLPAEYEHLPADRKVALAREWAAADFADAVRPGPDDPPVRNGGRGARRTGAGRDGAPDAAIPATAPPVRPATDPGGGPDADPDRARTAGNAGSGDPVRGRDGGADGDGGPVGALARRFPLPVTTGAAVGGGALLASTWSAGLPALAALFVVNAGGFVGGLFASAFGPGSEPK